jgi:hypothetical protein
MYALKRKIAIYQVTVVLSVMFTVIGFSYNVWRMEVTEQNNTIRTASFELLLNLAKLEQNIYLAHYDGDLDAGNPRYGWVLVGLIRDLSVLTDDTVEFRALSLHQTWSNHWDTLGSNSESVSSIVLAIDAQRQSIKALLKTLD